MYSRMWWGVTWRMIVLVAVFVEEMCLVCGAWNVIAG